MKLPYNGAKMSLLNTRDQQIKSQVSGMSYFFCGYWTRAPIDPQTL